MGKNKMAKRLRKQKEKGKIANLKHKRGNKLKSAKAAKLDRKARKMPTRTKAKTRLLAMYKEKPDYDEFYKQKAKPVRIAPNRKWFGNVRTIGQKSLEKYRIELAEATRDPYQVLLSAKKLPISLLKNPLKEKRANLLDVEKYEETFGPKSQRKKARLQHYNLKSLQKNINEKHEEYKIDQDRDLTKYKIMDSKLEARDKRHESGQSMRIWNELYKVLDSSDVVCIVLDARDPNGTRCYHIEKYITKHAQFKHLVLILNKIDLVPTSVTYKWVKYLSKKFPTLAFRASVKNPFGKGQLIQLIRQFDNFHKDKKTVSVGFVGYPNVGKSSVINTLKGKKQCKQAPIPGETRVWQYIHLTKRIYLIDCPGVVYKKEGTDDTQTVLKNVVRTEKIQDPAFYVAVIIKKVNPKTLQKLYGIAEWEDCDDFLEKCARRMGKLVKGNRPDIHATSKIIVQDWQRGRIPYYSLPPEEEVEAEEEDKNVIQNIDKKNVLVIKGVNDK